MCVCVLVGICAMSVGALRGLKVFSPPELELHTGNCELPMRVLGPKFSPLQDPSFPPCFSFPTHLHKQNPGIKQSRKEKGFVTVVDLLICLCFH